MPATASGWNIPTTNELGDFTWKHTFKLTSAAGDIVAASTTPQILDWQAFQDTALLRVDACALGLPAAATGTAVDAWFQLYRMIPGTDNSAGNNSAATIASNAVTAARYILTPSANTGAAVSIPTVAGIDLTGKTVNVPFNCALMGADGLNPYVPPVAVPTSPNYDLNEASPAPGNGPPFQNLFHAGDRIVLGLNGTSLTGLVGLVIQATFTTKIRPGLY